MKKEITELNCKKWRILRPGIIYVCQLIRIAYLFQFRS